MTSRYRLVEDGVELEMRPEEIALLSELPAMLTQVGDPATDAGAVRLNPPVYLGDPEADAEWRRLAGSELDSARRADRTTFQTVLDEVATDDASTTVVTLDQARAVLRVVNEARLVLGARWQVDGPEDYDALTPEAEAVMGFLGWIVTDLSETLGKSLDRR